MKLFTLVLLFSITQTFSQEEGFNDLNTLSESEHRQSQNYQHQGRIDRLKQDECLKNGDLCATDNAFKGDGARKLEAMIPMVAKMYGMFFGMTGGKIKMNENKKKDEREATDVCNYIPMVVEMGVAAKQALANDQIRNQSGMNQSERPVNFQKESLYAGARVHEERKQNAIIQTAGWATTAACYGAYIAAGASLKGKDGFKIIAKTAAAGFMATFFGLKANAHKDRAAELMLIGDSIPGDGDCNPFTEYQCFCAEPTSATFDPENYQKVCVPQQLAGRPKGTYPSPCIDQNNKVDYACECARRNTCIDNKLRNGIAGFTLGSNLIDTAFQGLSPLTQGHIPGTLDATGNQQLAFAKKMVDQALKEYKPEGKLNLNDAQSKEAKFMSDNGIPPLLAAQIAAAPLNNSDMNRFAAYRPTDDQNIQQALEKVKKGGNYSKTGGTSSNSRSAGVYQDPFAKFKKPQAGAPSGPNIEVHDFEQRAMEKADINFMPEKMIFEIITHRYKQSAWRELRPSYYGEDEAIVPETEIEGN
jgi:hypothetical protein